MAAWKNAAFIHKKISLLLTEKHTRKIALLYAGIFAIVSCWYIYHRLVFTSIWPAFFLAKADITGHLIMGTNLQHALIESRQLRIIFDLLYFFLPFLMVFTFIKKYRAAVFIAWFSILFNTVYVYLFSMMSFVSIEPLVTWIFMPLLFTARSLPSFYFKMHAIRILFILFFVSAGLWKLRTGEAFDTGQMSGILASQHAAILASGQNNFFIQLVSFLIDHPAISWLMYLLVIAGELFFLAGLFTKRFDRVLIIILIVFIVFDYYLMEINYFSWLPFALCFYYSKYYLPETLPKQLA